MRNSTARKPTQSEGDRAFKLLSKIMENLCEGNRDPQVVLDGLQRLTEGGLPNLLERIGVHNIEGTHRFDASQKFSKEEMAGVPIAWTGRRFHKHFLDEHLVENAAPIGLSVHDLQDTARCGRIIPLLAGQGVNGGNDMQGVVSCIRIRLAHWWSLLKAQSGGIDDGPLSVDGRRNIGFTPDSGGDIRAVIARWHPGDGWSLETVPVDRRLSWSPGSRFISRDS